jgi:nitronate monooxygenase
VNLSKLAIENKDIDKVSNFFPKTTFMEHSGVSFPLIMAPMFLVSNVEMMLAGMRCGVMPVFPSLNFRKEGELKAVLERLNAERAEHGGTYGVNLIVQRTNPLLEKHLAVCLEAKVPFYITSLGNPAAVAEGAHHYGGLVYSDVINLRHAALAAAAGCDGFIAVGQGAGGHAGPHPLPLLIAALKRKFGHLPVIAAGGIADGRTMLSAMAAGADGVSVGTRFIASKEAGVPLAYKEAVVKSGIEDIVMTERLSGTPCAVIDTPEVRKAGLKQNVIERWLSQNKQTKKWFKMLVQYRGMKKLEKSVFPLGYHNVWSAGKSSELVEDILSCNEIVEKMKREYQFALAKLISSTDK